MAQPSCSMLESTGVQKYASVLYKSTSMLGLYQLIFRISGAENTPGSQVDNTPAGVQIRGFRNYAHRGLWE